MSKIYLKYKENIERFCDDFIYFYNYLTQNKVKLSNETGQPISSSMSAEEKHQLLFEAGLIKDNMSNNVMVYGIQAWRKEGEHQGISGFYKQKEPLSITLSTIIGKGQY